MGSLVLNQYSASGNRAFATCSLSEPLSLGLVDFQSARDFQNLLVEKRASGLGEDLLIFCEHPHVVTLGRNFSPAELGESRAALEHAGIEIRKTDRGGKATYHGPGQLIVYPVISLKARSLSVRRFVALGLEALARVLRAYGLPAQVQLEDAGVWVRGKKLAAVGLSISRGVSNHGFSLNVSNTLEYFQLFNPCGMSPERMGSLEMLLNKSVAMETVSAAVYSEFQVLFDGGSTIPTESAS